MEKQYELGMLEKAYKDSIKNYRALIRWGLDETFDDANQITEQLISRSRSLLDEKSLPSAKEALLKLSNHLQKLKASFPKAKGHIHHDLQDFIEFIEDAIHSPASGSKGNIAADHEIDKDLERSRFAMQNEDWEESRKFLYQAINRYLEKVQQRLSKEYHELPRTDNTGYVAALSSLAEGSASCRSIPLENVQKLFQLSSQRNTIATGIGVCASPDAIARLFSTLSNTDFHLPDDGQPTALNAAVLRLVIDRNNTLYIIGVPLHSRVEPNEIRAILANFSSIQINLDDCVIPKMLQEKLMVYCLENLHKTQITLSGERLKKDVIQSRIDLIHSLAIVEEELVVPNFINWAKAKFQ